MAIWAAYLEREREREGPSLEKWNGTDILAAFFKRKKVEFREVSRNYVCKQVGVEVVESVVTNAKAKVILAPKYHSPTLA